MNKSKFNLANCIGSFLTGCINYNIDIKEEGKIGIKLDVKTESKIEYKKPVIKIEKNL